MFDYRYPLLEVVQAIEQLGETRGTTNVKVCDFVRKRGKNPNDPMKVLKTVRTLNKLVEDGVLVKRGRRYLFAPKAGGAKQEEEDEEEEDDQDDEGDQDGEEDDNLEEAALVTAVEEMKEELMDCGDENVEDDDEDEDEEDEDEDDDQEDEDQDQDDEEDEEDDDDDDDDEDEDDGNETTEIVFVDKVNREKFPVSNDEAKNNNAKTRDGDNKDKSHTKKAHTNMNKPCFKKNTSKGDGGEGPRVKCIKSLKKGNKGRCIIITKKANNSSNSGKKKEGVEQMEIMFTSRRRNSKTRKDYGDQNNHRSRSPIKGNRAALYQVEETGSESFKNQIFKEPAEADMDVDADKEGGGNEIYPPGSSVGPVASETSDGNLVDRKNSFGSEPDPNSPSIKQEKVEAFEEEGAEELVDVDSRQSLLGSGKGSAEGLGRARDRGKEKEEKIVGEEYKAVRSVCEKKKRNS